MVASIPSKHGHVQKLPAPRASSEVSDIYPHHRAPIDDVQANLGSPYDKMNRNYWSKYLKQTKCTYINDWYMLTHADAKYSWYLFISLTLGWRPQWNPMTKILHVETPPFDVHKKIIHSSRAALSPSKGCMFFWVNARTLVLDFCKNFQHSKAFWSHHCAKCRVSKLDVPIPMQGNTTVLRFVTGTDRVLTTL